MSTQDASTNGSYSELERLSAVETLKALSNPDQVTIAELVAFLRARDMWSQFAKVTLGDLRDAFSKSPEETGKKKKKKLFGDEFDTGEAPKKKERTPNDGGIANEEVARQVLPFVEGNGEVGFEDLVEYTRLDRKVLRHHLGLLVKAERLERLGSGRTAIYSTLG